QLRQVRSKFHCPSTYTLCRSSSAATNSVTRRPFTIWTLADYEISRLTQAKIGSQLFQTIATAVINNGE
ncbi:hypothetical protein BDF19DRAFT_339226, partial [Syncephalis fuscata]